MWYIFVEIMSILLNLKFYRCSKTHSVSQGAILVVRENIPRFTPQPSVAPGVAPGVLGLRSLAPYRPGSWKNNTLSLGRRAVQSFEDNSFIFSS